MVTVRKPERTSSIYGQHLVAIFLNGENTLTPEVDAAGIYFLSVTDTLTGCMAIDSVEIGIDTLAPDADAGPNGSITCVANTVQLDGSTSTANAIFIWTTNNGNICSDPNMEDVNACAAGTYYFTVTNSVNGCSSLDSTMVDADDDFPEVDVGGPLYFTCVDTVFTIQSVVTMPGSGVLDFEWTTADGCFTSPTDILATHRQLPRHLYFDGNGYGQQLRIHGISHCF